MAEGSDRLLTVTEVARMLGVQVSTIRAWTYERRLPVVKLRGRAVRFRLSAIEKIIREDERPALRSLSDIVDRAR